MAAEGRIPRNIALFIAYMKRTLNYLLAASPAPFTDLDWQRFNWDPQELTDYQDFNTRLDPMAVIFEANPKGDPENLQAIHELCDEVHAWDKKNHSIDRISAGYPKTRVQADYTTFGIKRNAPKAAGSMPVERLVATLNIVTFSMVGIGGGIMHYLARANKASKRAHILKGYKLAIMWLILNEGDAVPTDVSKLTEHTTSTRANNKLPVGAENSRKRIAVAMYWEHKTKKTLDGPPSPIQVIVIV